MMAGQDRKTSGAADVMVYNNIIVLILEDLETDYEKRQRLKKKIIMLQFILLRGENDSKQSDEIQSRVSPDCAKSFVDLDRTL